ncbi:cytosolic beta-glucosidase-like [Cydia strobilella]|uniref:cytosolic beta-glucosidase-like n=1 Tax=Cydia strobilella TaxID=1100964 RepID=UPI003007DE9B
MMNLTIFGTGACLLQRSKMLVPLVLLTLCVITQANGNASVKKFPENFLLGAATSAYQIEGGWNADGKGESVWDYYLHKQPDIVKDFTNGDIAADSYHLYERDVEILKELGAKAYRFSISWTRILPDGTTNFINPHGIAYYSRLIDLLLADNILPLVTLYHWDLPIAFSNNGGWLNETTGDRFGEYARIVFNVFGDKVKHWITVNEPSIHCSFMYEYGIHPPLKKSPGVGFYECGRNLLLAHAKAYHIYDVEFRKNQGGKVGLSLDAEWPIAASDSLDDLEAVKDYLAFSVGQYMDPIFKGDYPERLVNRIAAASRRQGCTSSRLQPFTDKQKAYINGTADFVGINHYFSLYVYRNESVRGYETPSFLGDTELGTFQDPSWPQSAFTRMREYAPGLYCLLMYLKDTYHNPAVYITENGFPMTPAEDLNDDKKAHYLRAYLKAVLDAKADGSNCQGYFFWSLVDGLEWASGLQKYKFGLYQVDYNDPSRKRTARKSALVYKEIIHSGTIDFSYNPDPYGDKCFKNT